MVFFVNPSEVIVSDEPVSEPKPELVAADLGQASRNRVDRFAPSGRMRLHATKIAKSCTFQALESAGS